MFRRETNPEKGIMTTVAETEMALVQDTEIRVRRGKGGRRRASIQSTIPHEKLVILQNLTVAASRLTAGEIKELVDDVSEMSLRGPSLRSRPALLAEISMLVRPMELVIWI